MARALLRLFEPGACRQLRRRPKAKAWGDTTGTSESAPSFWPGWPAAWCSVSRAFPSADAVVARAPCYCVAPSATRSSSGVRSSLPPCYGSRRRQ